MHFCPQEAAAICAVASAIAVAWGFVKAKFCRKKPCCTKEASR